MATCVCERHNCYIYDTFVTVSVGNQCPGCRIAELEAQVTKLSDERSKLFALATDHEYTIRTAIAYLRNDQYKTRVKNALRVLEDAIDD
jgi:hypothetical protein